MRYINKELYVNCLNALKDYSDKEMKVYEATDGLVNFIDFDELQEVLSKFIELLEYCTEDDDYDNLEGTNLSLFMYDNNFGEAGDYKTPEELWDNCIMKNNSGEIEE